MWKTRLNYLVKHLQKYSIIIWNQMNQQISIQQNTNLQSSFIFLSFSAFISGFDASAVWAWTVPIKYLFRKVKKKQVFMKTCLKKTICNWNLLLMSKSYSKLSETIINQSINQIFLLITSFSIQLRHTPHMSTRVRMGGWI